MKLPITNFKFRIPIKKKSAKPAAARRAHDAGHSPFAIRHSPLERGFALVITLILLSVTLIMAVAFLAISRRERGSVVTTTDTATARLAADSALASAEAQIMSSVLATTNPYINNLLVSTNYINRYGFVTDSANPTNVNYDYYSTGSGPLSSPDFLQNVANLFYLPRAPVYVPTNNLGSNDFRFYLDLNRNGKFEDSGAVTNYDNLGNVILDNSGNATAFQMGDPQWIGVLERPDAPHGPNNKFVARYAFIALPADNIDLNYSHNQSLHGNANTAVNPTQPGVGDVFFRNQGVGSWEINLAAFLTDLNPNEWDPPTAENLANNPYQYIPPPLIGGNLGVAFEDARALLAYRYTNNFSSLAFVPALFPNYPLTGGPMDIFPFGSPLGQAMATTATPFYNYNLNNFWPGADNINHFFALPSDLFDPNKTGLGVAPAQIAANNYFTGRLLDAGVNYFGGKTNSTYDRYTFYRLLAQLGTDSSPESGKMNLNYDNLTTNGPPAGTNFVAWTPLAFFTNAADRMLRLYTTNWFQGNSSGFYTNYTTVTNLIYVAPSNYLATYYGIQTNYFSYIDAQGRYIWNDPSGFGLTNVPLFGMTNQIPAFGVTNIPVYINGQYVYSSAVQRVLQLAANIFDASTNSFYPSVFRPLFAVDAASNVFIVTYTNLNSANGPGTVSGPNDLQLSIPFDAAAIAALNGGHLPLYYPSPLDNIYGVPWIIGAKKGFPNFNEFSMNNVVQVNRKLQIKRANYDYPPVFDYTNVTYVFGIGSTLGIEFWNSYTNAYTNSLQIVVNDTFSFSLTNGPPFDRAPFVFSNSYSIFTNTSVVNWPNSLQANPFIFQTTNVSFITNLAYQVNGPYPFLDDGTAGWQTNVTSLPPLPQLGLTTANRLQTYMLENNHIIDYAHFGGPNTNRNLNVEIQTLGNTEAYTNMWTTNVNALGLSYSIINQMDASKGLITPDSTYWQPGSYRISDIDGFSVFMGGSQTALPIMPLPASQTADFNGYLTNLTHQVPFTPTVTVYDYTTWQANDPLVHYLASDLNFLETSNLKTPTGLSKTYKPPVSLYGTLANIGKLNDRYAPWGIPGYPFTGADNNAYNYAYKDPAVTNSDAWNFPTNKFPTVGWLGRVHRGTPWQTVFLKATNILNLANAAANGLSTWTNWTGDFNINDAVNARPTQDYLLFDLFTTAPNDNATRGQLSVNVAADPNDPAAGLAAWSALFSGIAVPTSLTNSYTVIQPAGTAGTNSPLETLVLGINNTRTNFVNPDGLQGSFEHVGYILSTPQLTQQSPFIAGQNLTNGVNDALMEWLPQQTLSLLRAPGNPRYVIYCYGQALRPAPNGVVTSGGQAYFGMVTNYQVVAESATRAVVQFQPVVVTNSLNGAVSTNYNATIEQFNPLPPD